MTGFALPPQDGDASTLAVVVDRLRRIGASLDAAIDKMATKDDLAREVREAERDMQRLEETVKGNANRIRDLEKLAWGSGALGTGGGAVGLYALWKMASAAGGG